LDYGIREKMIHLVEYFLDRKYIGSPMTLFHGAKNIVGIVLLNI